MYNNDGCSVVVTMIIVAVEEAAGGNRFELKTIIKYFHARKQVN